MDPLKIGQKQRPDTGRSSYLGRFWVKIDSDNWGGQKEEGPLLGIYYLEGGGRRRFQRPVRLFILLLHGGINWYWFVQYNMWKSMAKDSFKNFHHWSFLWIRSKKYSVTGFMLEIQFLSLIKKVLLLNPPGTKSDLVCSSSSIIESSQISISFQFVKLKESSDQNNSSLYLGMAEVSAMINIWS